MRAEEEAIAIYKQTVGAAIEENDCATVLLLEEIVKDEEGRHYKLSIPLEKD